MQQPDEFLERIRYSECARNIISTSILSPGRYFIKHESLDSKQFTPSWLIKGAAIAVPVWMFVFILKDVNSWADLSVVMVGLVSNTCVLALILYRFFLGKSYNFTILVSAEGIKVNDALYVWEEVYDTAILKRRSGKYFKKYLVIAMKDKCTYHMCDMSNFFSVNMLDATTEPAYYIEHFKSIHKIISPATVLVEC